VARKAGVKVLRFSVGFGKVFMVLIKKTLKRQSMFYRPFHWVAMSKMVDERKARLSRKTWLLLLTDSLYWPELQ